MWYSKRRRAQNDQDFETWIEGGVCPTLNAFDNTGDSRATVLVFAPGPMVRLGGNIWEGIVPTLRAEAKRGDAEPHILIIDGTRVDDVRVYEGPVQTLKERMGTGGNNVPVVAIPIQDGREHAPETILFDADRRVGVRLFEDDVVPTLMAFMGTGGNNVPMVAQELPILMRGREGKPGGGKGPLLSENMSLTLAGANDQVLFAIPIQDGREMEKKQNGLGVGGEGDPAYTLDQTGAQAIAYSIREDATANTFSATEIETARSLSAVRPSVQSHHAQTFITQAYDEYNDKLGGDVHHALRAGTKQSTGVLVNGEIAATLRSGGDGGVPSSRGEHLAIEPTMQVRRLTPIECERLMGWPDNHTLHRADGGVNSDTARYKMCGNGVASPVAQWIAEQILPIHEAL